MRVWIVVEVATPQSGTVASEDSLPPVTWSPSLKVSTGSFMCRSTLKFIFQVELCHCDLPEHSQLFSTICRQRQRLSGAWQPVAQRRRWPARGNAVFHLGVLLRDLQRVSVRPAGRPTQPVAEEEGDAAAERWQAWQPLRERWTHGVSRLHGSQ